MNDIAYITIHDKNKYLVTRNFPETLDFLNNQLKFKLGS